MEKITIIRMISEDSKKWSGQFRSWCARQNRKNFVNLTIVNLIQSLWEENVTLWESKCFAAN